MFDAFTLNQLIREHGQTVTLKKRAMSVYDAATGTVTETATTYQVKAYPYSIKAELSDFSIEGGSQAFAISNKLLNGKDTPLMDTDDQVVLGSQTYDIVKVSKIYSAGKVMVYMTQVKD